MKRAKGRPTLLDAPVLQTPAILSFLPTEDNAQEYGSKAALGAAGFQRRGSTATEISKELPANRPPRIRTAAERFAERPPSPDHLQIQWTPAHAARTLALWQGLLQWDAPQKYPDKSVLFSQGDEANCAFLLSRGIVKLAYSSPDGGQHLVGLRYPGDLIGDWWLDIRIRCPFSAVTAVPCEIHRMDSTLIRETAAHDDNARRVQTETLQRDLCSLAAKYLDLKALTPTRLLERLLWELASVLGGFASDGSARLVLPFTNAEMADLCGLSVSHYKEVRRELELVGRVKHSARRLWILHGKGR